MFEKGESEQVIRVVSDKINRGMFFLKAFLIQSVFIFEFGSLYSHSFD